VRDTFTIKALVTFRFCAGLRRQIDRHQSHQSHRPADSLR